MIQKNREPTFRLASPPDPGSLAKLGGSVGYFALGPLESASLVELTAAGDAPEAARREAEEYFRSLGLHVEWVGDSPGLVSDGSSAARQRGRLCAAAGRRRRRGHRHGDAPRPQLPSRPAEWGDSIGLDRVLAVLDALRGELGEERYRAAPLLRRMVADGRLGKSTGRGFFSG